MKEKSKYQRPVFKITKSISTKDVLLASNCEDDISDSQIVDLAFPN